jgi:uncharacterized damage-inducible protein DinB
MVKIDDRRQGSPGVPAGSNPVNEAGPPPLHITSNWATLTDHLIEIVDAIPDDKMNWSPSQAQWNFRGTFLHIAGARHHWLANVIHDGEATPDLFGQGQTKDGLKEQLRLSWERLERFLRSPSRLVAVYEPPTGAQEPDYYGDPLKFDGHFIAYHRLVHDIHHRADLLQYLTILRIELPRRRRPL